MWGIFVLCPPPTNIIKCDNSYREDFYEKTAEGDF